MLLLSARRSDATAFAAEEKELKEVDKKSPRRADLVKEMDVAEEWKEF